jgi:hypothetical protein
MGNPRRKKFHMSGYVKAFINLGVIGITMAVVPIVTQTVWAATLSSIEIQPASSTTLLAGQTLQLTARGIYSDGTTADISSQVAWSISNGTSAKVSPSGLVSMIESAGGPGMPGKPGEGNAPGKDSRPGSGPSMGAGPGGNPPPGGMPPQGNPGMPGGFPGPGGPGGGSDRGGMPAPVTVSVSAALSGITSPSVSLSLKPTEGPATYLQSGNTVTKTNQTFTASGKSTSGVKVADKGTLTLVDSMVTTSGNTTGMEHSSFYGLNAGVLALPGSKITMTNGTITTKGTGANGAFAVGAGSIVELSKVKIDCVATGAHGVDATIAGTILCTDVDITTAGNGAAAAISTDRGSGTITFTCGSATTSGTRSPGIYSTGSITVSDAKITATGSEAIVIEGKNSVTLKNTNLSCLKQCGAMLYQSFSGDAGIGTSVLTMIGGSLTAAEGPMFKVTNTNAVVDLKGDAKINAASGILIKAAADQWGREGSNGGHLTLKADGETLTGDIVCDKISTISLVLQNKTTLKGKMNTEDTAKGMALTLDAGSAWEVTGTSYLSVFTDQDTTLANIHDNGHTIYYDSKAEANKWLDGKTHSLPGGGKLTGR